MNVASVIQAGEKPVLIKLHGKKGLGSFYSDSERVFMKLLRNIMCCLKIVFDSSEPVRDLFFLDRLFP